MIYRVAIKCADSYSKEKRGYLASSRIRGHWLARYWSEADDGFYKEEFPQYEGDFFNPKNQMKILREYDIIIFNKTYEWRLAKLLRENNQVVIVDMCDPDHLKSHSSRQRVNDCLNTLKYANVVVVNSKVLKKSVKQVYGGLIEIIPDRIDLKFSSVFKKEHSEELKRIVWYGYSENLRVLEPYLKEIINMGLELTIISDRFFENLFLIGCKYKPHELITFKAWHPNTINKQIIQHDVVFIGKDPDSYLSQFKSDNREMTAYALGMPVAHTIKDLKKLKSKCARIENAKNGNYLCRKDYDIRHSVWQYNKLAKKLLRRKK